MSSYYPRLFSQKRIKTAGLFKDPRIVQQSGKPHYPRFLPPLRRQVADHIAGMTDRYAIDRCAEIYGRVPEGLRLV